MADAPSRDPDHAAPEPTSLRNGTPRLHGTPAGTPEPVSNTVRHLPSSGDREARRRRIAEGAYYRAERRGFAPGGEVSDWLEAEKEIEQDAPGSDTK